MVLLAWPYIGLGVALPFGAWDLDAPVADLAAAALIPVVLALDTGLPRLPGLVGYALLLLAGVLGEGDTHTLVRKVAFCWIAYGWALPWVLANVTPAPVVRALVRTAVLVVAVVSLTSSIGRIGTGNALWFQAVEGLTNNHKTLAVAMAPTLPILWAWRSRWLAGLVALAVALSLSRTAWISAAVGMSYFLGWGGRPLATRRGVVAGVVLVGIAIAFAAPLMTRSAAQLDALRSRHSLDKRAWALFSEEPWVGAGAGANVRYEAHTFPDYRVNGVEAHGVVQKVGSEHGLLGLAGYAIFVATLALAVRARHVPGEGAWPAFVALHANLLFSTEAFTQTHWVVLGVVLALGRR